MLTNEVICTCAEITKQQIVNTINKNGIKTIDKVCEETGAGMICGGCRPVIQEIINKYTK
ncbi:MAG: (2Fe-2S)-binding protein [Bacteroidia bacterium]|nr:(2Fe-2S)-binding protein [Bacteroidia bacterium]